MIHRKKKVTARELIFFFVILSFFMGFLHAVVYSEDRIEQEVLTDGIEYWRRVNKVDKKPWFFRFFENTWDVILPSADRLPFGESVAFLVGVSEYEHLTPQLPFVRNDIRELRDFLLHNGGFDTVYVVEDAEVTPELVERYMLNKFRQELNRQDRLLFYYSGHGADVGGNTGYMQFSQAKPNDLVTHVLAINRCEEWSRIIPVKHILFVYDCCASGLAFIPKTSSDDSAQILRTLSGDGSRTVITAGTAGETYGFGGKSIFTEAFLESLRNPDQRYKGFMTINQIFARIEILVKESSQKFKKTLTPRRWELQEDDYRGTFVFVDPDTIDASIPQEYAEALQVRQKGIGETTGELDTMDHSPEAKITEDGAHMMLIPAGSFLMGSNDGEEDEKPAHTIYLDAFYIDEFEVTNAQYAKFLNSYLKLTEIEPRYLFDSKYCLIEEEAGFYRSRAGYEEHPVIGVNWHGAKAYAEFYDKGLPSEAQWEKAARGTLIGMKYPWGDEIHPINANYDFKDSRTADSIEHTLKYLGPVGRFPANTYGLHDMAGNVQEWCADWYDAGYYANSPERNPEGPKSGSYRVLRGGSWNNDSSGLRVARRNKSNSTYSNIGFRCVWPRPK